MDYKNETIAAIATPVGIGGIGIIQISGKLAAGIAQKVFRPKRPIKSFDNFRLYLGHIIDPRSGMPVSNSLRSVTVVADDCITADALATAIFVLGARRGMELVEKIDGVECFLILKPGSGRDFLASGGLGGYLR